MTRKLWIFIKVLVIFSLGFMTSLWILSYDRQKDEYAYALKVTNLLFMSENQEVNDELNGLLHAHFNRYMRARGLVPSVFSSEVDDLFCSTFIMEGESQDQFDRLIIRDGLSAYIASSLAFCRE